MNTVMNLNECRGLRSFTFHLVRLHSTETFFFSTQNLCIAFNRTWCCQFRTGLQRAGAEWKLECSDWLWLLLVVKCGMHWVPPDYQLTPGWMLPQQDENIWIFFGNYISFIPKVFFVLISHMKENPPDALSAQPTINWHGCECFPCV